MDDKLNITIRIAELPPIALQIARHEEENIRTAEYNVNRLWNNWRHRFTDKSSTEVLGMVAFQFAKLYTILNSQVNEAETMLQHFEKELDNILLDMASATSDKATPAANAHSQSGKSN